MARPKSNARAELLASAIAWVADNGIGDVSLRALAEAIGTSHRMLLFHFGSKEQLMVEVVRAVEADQRATVVEIAADDGVDITLRMRQHWLSLLDPSLRNNIRLFYEVYADALRGRAYTKDFLDEVMAAWLPPVTAAFESTSGAANAPSTRGWCSPSPAVSCSIWSPPATSRGSMRRCSASRRCSPALSHPMANLAV